MSSDTAVLEDTLETQVSEEVQLLVEHQILQQRLAEQDRYRQQKEEARLMELSAAKGRLLDAKVRCSGFESLESTDLLRQTSLTDTLATVEKQSSIIQQFSGVLDDATVRKTILRSENEGIRSQLDALAVHRRAAQYRRGEETAAMKEKIAMVKVRLPSLFVTLKAYRETGRRSSYGGNCRGTVR